MQRHRVAQVGCGMRGKRHLGGWLSNPDRFEVVAICDLDRGKAQAAAEESGITPAIYTDADTMLKETRPEVFCFSTQPDVRLSLVKLAAKHRIAGLVFEKPMATSIADAWEMTRLCRESGIKAAVSHQQKYLTSFQKLKEIVDAGEVGEIIRTEATCQPWLSHLGTHYIDYILWVNGGARAKWVVGHAHGRDLLTDSHPSPNYTMGQFALENGVRAYVEFGKLSASHLGPDKFWVDNRMTVQGTHGYVWCDTDGRWGALTRSSAGKVLAGEGDDWETQERDRLQALFARDFADWLDDDRRVHPCNMDISYHGFEIAEGLYISAMEHRRVDLPLDPQASGDIIARMLAELPECPEYRAKSE